MKKILVFICSYNSKNYTRKVYDELTGCTEFIDIIIIDNSNLQEEICDFGNCYHIGFENVEYGGMHDYILKMPILEKYDFIGIFNNDIHGFTLEHFNNLQKYLTSDVGYLSFSISSEFDKVVEHASNGVMHNRENSNFRIVNFIENIAPIYNKTLIKELQKYIPIHKYALIDFLMSRKSTELGLKNLIIDENYIHHMRSGVRKKVGSFSSYQANADLETSKWIGQHPELQKYFI